jgi:hypothetical protein
MAALALRTTIQAQADRGTDQLVDDAEVHIEHQAEDRRIGDLADDDGRKECKAEERRAPSSSGELSSTAMTVARRSSPAPGSPG